MSHEGQPVPNSAGVGVKVERRTLVGGLYVERSLNGGDPEYRIGIPDGEHPGNRNCDTFWEVGPTAGEVIFKIIPPDIVD